MLYFQFCYYDTSIEHLKNEYKNDNYKLSQVIEKNNTDYYKTQHFVVDIRLQMLYSSKILQ